MNIRMRLYATGLLLLVLDSLAAHSLAYQTEQGDAGIAAKALALLTVAIPDDIEVRNVQITITQDDEEDSSRAICVLRAPGVDWQISTAEGRPLLSVPVVSCAGRRGFVFPEPGVYRVRWLIATGRPEEPSLKIEERVAVNRSLEADPGFIAQLTDAEFLRAVVGADIVVNGTNPRTPGSSSEQDLVGAEMVDLLLQATRHDWVGDIMSQAGPKGDVRKAADMLWRLAQDNPDSSYAPYAAYYAGCCFAANAFETSRHAITAQTQMKQFENDVAEGKFRASFLKTNQDCLKAFEAFRFAGDHGDGYLQPRALYQHATWRSVIFDLDRTEELLTRARAVAPGRGHIQERIDELLDGLPKIRAQLGSTGNEEPSERHE